MSACHFINLIIRIFMIIILLLYFSLFILPRIPVIHFTYASFIMIIFIKLQFLLYPEFNTANMAEWWLCIVYIKYKCKSQIPFLSSSYSSLCFLFDCLFLCLSLPLIFHNPQTVIPARRTETQGGIPTEHANT